MRKLFVFMMVSLDGFFEGENHDLTWHNVDKEFNEFAIEQLNEADTLLFGRKTYDLMRNFWPIVQPTDPLDEIVAQKMNVLPKIVISKTLRQVQDTSNWKNNRLISENIISEIENLKQQQGKDIALLGSNTLMVSLAEHNVIDEFRFMINPIAIGKGTQLFSGLLQKLPVSLSVVRKFTSGNVLLFYKPKVSMT